MTLNKKILGTLVVSALLSATTAYAANVPAGTKLAKKQDMVINNGSEPGSLDPQLIQGTIGTHIAQQLFEGLVNQDSNGKTVPGVAKNWVNKDNKVFIFHLRDDAKWSNGKPVTAQDFVFAWRRLVDPKTASPYSYYLQLTGMKNVDAIVDGKMKPEALGVKALNAHTLQVTLSHAVPYFVKMLANSSVFPVYPPVVKKWGDQWTQPQHIVSNGAYKLTKWVVNSRIVMVRNPDYWNNKKTVINKVTFLPVSNQVAAMNRFMAGEIDMTYEVPNEQFKHLKKDYPQDLKVTGFLCNYYYDFNNKKPPFNDVRIRKALSYAINRNIITKYVTGKGEKPLYTFTPGSTAGFTAPKVAYGEMTQAQRLAKAKQLMAEAGYGKGGKQLNVSILYNTSANHKKIALAVGQMWKKLGVHVTLENQEWKTFLNTRQNHQFTVARDAWCGDYNEASTFMTLMMTGNVQNNADYSDKAYDAIMNKALNTANDEKRNAMYADAEKILAKDMPVAPVYQYVNARLVKPFVGGYPMHNALDYYYVKNFYIKAH
ncbi:MAG: Periplasmic oligopeptide-binding protein [Candidatus Celerinatantimonas neptuna]|nr:MAG: Periplasmic oligopeptide-binding protein [Candidatus Celerinatantimonas neptuna]